MIILTKVVLDPVAMLVGNFALLLPPKPRIGTCPFRIRTFTSLETLQLVPVVTLGALVEPRFFTTLFLDASSIPCHGMPSPQFIQNPHLGIFVFHMLGRLGRPMTPPGTLFEYLSNTRAKLGPCSFHFFICFLGDLKRHEKTLGSRQEKGPRS